jgi:glycine hydroxymethyltransferase
MVNKNLIPFDSRGANTASGIRIGTPAVTTRGMKEPEMEIVADMIDTVLRDHGNETVHRTTLEQVMALCKQFPFYSRLFSL